jgi:alpha-aminoadipic semialdehyde synthase
MGVSDISADYEGSIELTNRFTNIEEPFLVYDIINDSWREKINESDNNCILFHSIDHLPAEMPKEASNHFGSRLLPFIMPILDCKIDTPWEDQEKELPP